MTQFIFVVSGDPEIAQFVRLSLEEAGYSVRTFSTVDIIEEAESHPPSLLLTSLLLPDGSGLTLCRRIRENPILSGTPLVFLLTDAAEEHRVLALESGGDDCIVQPFSPRELVLRVQAVLRRFSTAVIPSVIDTAELVIDSLAMKLSVRGAEVPTTSLEFRLIEYLARHRGQVFTRDLLLDAVWGDMQFVTPRSVDACIRRIREKIEPDRARPSYLKTVRGVGYRLDAVTTWQSDSSNACDCVACVTAKGSSRLAYISTAKRRRSSVRNRAHASLAR
jgi:two-component system, OmpR family, alkaline phosphatase synthesis response regulator PhoP